MEIINSGPGPTGTRTERRMRNGIPTGDRVDGSQLRVQVFFGVSGLVYWISQGPGRDVEGRGQMIPIHIRRVIGVGLLSGNLYQLPVLDRTGEVSRERDDDDPSSKN